MSGNWGADILGRRIYGTPMFLDVEYGNTDILRRQIFKGQHHSMFDLQHANANFVFNVRPTPILYLASGRELAHVNFGILIKKTSVTTRKCFISNSF